MPNFDYPRLESVERISCRNIGSSDYYRRCLEKLQELVPTLSKCLEVQHPNSRSLERCRFLGTNPSRWGSDLGSSLVVVCSVGNNVGRACLGMSIGGRLDCPSPREAVFIKTMPRGRIKRMEKLTVRSSNFPLLATSPKVKLSSLLESFQRCSFTALHFRTCLRPRWSYSRSRWWLCQSQTRKGSRVE